VGLILGIIDTRLGVWWRRKYANFAFEKKELEMGARQMKIKCRRKMLDELVSYEDIVEVYELIKAGVRMQNPIMARTFCEFFIGKKNEDDPITMHNQRMAMDMIKFLAEKGISNGMSNDEIISLIKNFDISHFQNGCQESESFHEVQQENENAMGFLGGHDAGLTHRTYGESTKRKQSNVEQQEQNEQNEQNELKNAKDINFNELLTEIY
jgi:hypothetical protein